MKYYTKEEKILICFVIVAAILAMLAINQGAMHFIKCIGEQAKERFLFENACPECEQKPIDINKYRRDVPIIEDDSG